jgi:hypothetical protein
MFTRNIKNTFTASLLNAVSGVLGEAKKKCSEGCECEACVPEEETNEGYVSHAQEKRRGGMVKESVGPDYTKYLPQELYNKRNTHMGIKKYVDTLRDKGGKIDWSKHPVKGRINEEVGKLGNQLKREHEAKEKKEPNGVKTEEVEHIDESLRHDRYMRSHGKKARGTGSWAFTTKQYGSPKENEMHFTSGQKSLSDAHKEATAKLGTKHLYVMEEVDNDVPFKGPYRKAGEERRDEYGNKVKNVAKYLAKKAMNTQKEEAEQIDELSTKSLEKYRNAARADAYDADDVDDDRRFRKRTAGITKANKAIRKNFVKGVDEEVKDLDEKRGLWDNIHAKRKRIKAGSGERMRKPGSKGAPSAADLKASQTEEVSVDEAFEQISEAPRVGMDYTHASEKSKFDSGHRAKLLNPEGRTSYLSQKSYKTAKHAKDAAKFYHSVSHLPMQTADNKMSQYNKAYDAKHKMSEEAEQIDEISREALASYTVNAAHDSKKHAVKAALKSQSGEDTSKEYRKLKNREKGIETAVSRLTQEEQDFIDSLNDADMEQIDELSVVGLDKYHKKAYQSMFDKDSDKKTVAKRKKGMDTAYNKAGFGKAKVYATEEAEDLDEARGRPRKAGAKDYTVHPKTKQKLMHNDPEDMKKIEALQRNGVIPVPKIEANQHIMQQLQRAKLSMRGGETINFTHGDSQHVAGHHAAKLLTKYAGMKPDEKEAFQKKIGHSHANLKSEL